MTFIKDALRNQQSLAIFEDEKQSLVKQEKRSILLVEDIVRNLIIVEFDQRISIMQNEITKNVMTTMMNLIRIEFAKIDVSQSSK